MKKRLLSALLTLCMLLALFPAAALAAGRDPYLSQQTNLTQINYFPVWEQGFDGAGVTIAVIDTGAYTRHEDLQGGNVLPTVNMLPSDHEEDSNGHGTFIAGMLAAARGNGVGIAGMVDGARILPFRCFTSRNTTQLNYITRAIYSAVDDYGCDVINLSLVLEEDYSTLRAAVDYAVDKGVIVVAATGNTGGTAVNYPAAYDSVVGVGSVDQKSKVSAFSQRNASVFVAAPGEDLISTTVTSDSSYASWSGTSFACVHVTALAAVAKQYDRSIDTARFMELLRRSAVDLGVAGYDTSYGWGLVNAGAFLDAMYAENEKRAAGPDSGGGSPAAAGGETPGSLAANVLLSPQRLTVDGKDVDCEKYNIDGSNYFKLRDLAQILNGTGSQFGVGFDEAASTVSITTGGAYESTGTELKTGVDNSGTAEPSRQSILIDGAVLDGLIVYNIGGSNFFRLRELGNLLGFEVDFDVLSNTAVVRTRQS